MRTCTVALLAISIAFAVPADFKVGESRDLVLLKDGTQVEGILVAAGPKAVVLVVRGKEGPEERVVMREEIEEITTGEASGHTVACTTDPRDGVKVVSGEGFRETESASGEESNSGGSSVDKEKVSSHNGETAGRNRVAVTAEKIRKAVEENPRLKLLVSSAGGAEKAAALLRDPDQRKRLEEMARKYKIDLPGIF